MFGFVTSAQPFDIGSECWRLARRLNVLSNVPHMLLTLLQCEPRCSAWWFELAGASSIVFCGWLAGGMRVLELGLALVQEGVGVAAVLMC